MAGDSQPNRPSQTTSNLTVSPRVRDHPPISPQPNGYIDFYGQHRGTAGWLFGCWLAGRWSDNEQPEVTAQFELGEASGDAIASFFYRSDLDEGSFGLLLFVPASNEIHGPLQTIEIRLGANLGWLHPTDGIKPLDETTLTARAKTVLANADPSPGRTRMTTLLRRRSFSGSDTTATLADFVRVGIDAAILCPPNGLVLAGWLLSEPGTVRDVRLRSGSLGVPVRLEQSIRLDRPDVLKAFQDSGLTDRRCGFLAYLPDVGAMKEPAYLEIETVDAEIGYVPLPTATLRGMPAIKHLLGLFEVRYAEVSPAFDTVIGPAVQALNKARLTDQPTVAITEFGIADPTPLYSIIVPLHGCIDFMEYQLAFFSRQDYAGHEFIYVLDDPDQDRAARELAESTYERFRVPFRLVTLDRNMGYAPANNIGLTLAQGSIVCFLNSDVFPRIDGWMRQLAARLDADPALGAVGPLLVFEDGSIQHQGIVFEAVPQFGNWMFPQHVRKGWRPPAEGGLRGCQAITAACLVMRTELAKAMNGFDEGFIIGDFEDTDLCLHMAKHGLTCAVDHDVHLIHLERRSQSASTATWRMNLTLYNAWLHQRRWFSDKGMPAGASVDRRLAAGPGRGLSLRSVSG